MERHLGAADVDSPVVLITGIAGVLFDWRIWLILIPLGVWLLRTLFFRLRDVLKLSATLAGGPRLRLPKSRIPIRRSHSLSIGGVC